MFSTQNKYSNMISSNGIIGFSILIIFVMLTAIVTQPVFNVQEYEKEYLENLIEIKELRNQLLNSDPSNLEWQVKFMKKHGIITTDEVPELLKRPHTKPNACDGLEMCDNEYCDTGAGWSLSSNDGANCVKCDKNYTFVGYLLKQDICILTDVFRNIVKTTLDQSNCKPKFDVLCHNTGSGCMGKCPPNGTYRVACDNKVYCGKCDNCSINYAYCSNKTKEIVCDDTDDSPPTFLRDN